MIEAPSTDAGQRLANGVLQVTFWIPLAVCTYLALAARLPDHPVFRLSDVILHGVAFGYLSFALVLVLLGYRRGRRRPYLVGGLLMLGYGVFIELAQSAIPERSAEVRDLLVDVVGIGIGLTAAHLLAAPLRRLIVGLSARFA